MAALPDDFLDEAPLYLPPEDESVERALRRAFGSSGRSSDLDWQCVSCGVWHADSETKCECGYVAEPPVWPIHGEQPA